MFTWDPPFIQVVWTLTTNNVNRISQKYIYSRKILFNQLLVMTLTSGFVYIKCDSRKT